MDKDYQNWLISVSNEVTEFGVSGNAENSSGESWRELLATIDDNRRNSIVWGKEKNIFHIFVPIKSDLNVLAIVASVNAENWLNSVRAAAPVPTRSIRIGHVGREIIGVDGLVVKNSITHRAVADINLAGEPWWVEVDSRSNAERDHSLSLSSVVLIAGLLVSS